MADIYEQHEKAFSNVSAYAILKDGKMVAKISFKYPKDGMSKLWAYVHWLGVPMVRGSASGCGYDKKTAACASAVFGIVTDTADEALFVSALEKDVGHQWDSMLRMVGFDVCQVL